MLKITLGSAFLVITGNIYANLFSTTDNKFQPTIETTIIYLNAKEANNYIEKTNYFKEQNLLSISLKSMGEIDEYNTETAKDKYRKYLSANLLEWRGREKKYINKRFEDVFSNIKKYTPAVLSDTIYLIKSSKNIEFSSPFTKGKAIVIPESYIPLSGMSWTNNNFFEQTLTHELFHIYSSNHLSQREQLYSLIGFEKIENVKIPDELKQMQIINPDDNISDYYKISLKNPVDDEYQNFIVLILSKYPKYEGYKGVLSRMNLLDGYSEIKLARIVKSNEGWNVKRKNDKPELYFKNDLPEYWEKIKLVHSITMTPEETLAEDFAILILARMKNKLSKFSSVEKEFLNDFELLLK